MAEIWERVKVPATGITGVSIGASGGEFLGEFGARATGQVGPERKWQEFGIKAVLKGVFGAVFFAISTRVPGLWALLTDMVGYGSVGTIILDFFKAVIPGGIPGIAEMAATQVRVWVMGAERVAAELKELEEEMGAESEEESPEKVEEYVRSVG